MGFGCWPSAAAGGADLQSIVEDGGREQVDRGVKTASPSASFMEIIPGFVVLVFWRKHVWRLVAEEAGGGGAGGCAEEEQVEGVRSQLGGGGGGGRVNS